MRYKSLGAIQVSKLKARSAIEWVVCVPCLMRSPCSHKSSLWMTTMYRQPTACRTYLASRNMLSLIYSACSMITTVQTFKSALELRGSDTTCKLVINADPRPKRQHGWRYNAHLCNDVAIVFVGEEHGKSRGTYIK